jgi:hypothetical protein
VTATTRRAGGTVYTAQSATVQPRFFPDLFISAAVICEDWGSVSKILKNLRRVTVSDPTPWVEPR